MVWLVVDLRADSHGILSPKSQVTWGRPILDVESMEFGTYHFTHDPKYDMDAYMATLFGDEAHDLCWELGW
jgi:hypothetical protein